MAGADPAARNAVSGGLFQGPVLQAETIHASFAVAGMAPTALAQLPPQVVAFTGRDRELAVVSGLLAPAAGEPAVMVTAVAGLAGVGKTALAVQAGHAARRQGWFGGGVLYIDLHGYDEQLVEPAQAVDSLLRALGLAAEHIPPGLDDRAALYRSALAQIAEPVLVIADNASSEAQVRALLPGTGPHKVLVTSRHTLAGLGARLVDVAVLDGQASAALLDAALRAARPDDDRISSDPDAAQRLARLCGGLPLALQITAARLAADPVLSAAEAAGELAATTGRLDHLRYDDGSQASAPSVAAAFELSYRSLDECAARLFRLLPVNPGPDVSAAAAAVLADQPVGEARRLLGVLARAHLAQAAPGPGSRWRMHDLVRLYAQRVGDEQADADGREQVRDRLLDHYLTMTRAADAHLRALPGVTLPEQFAGRDEALAWLDAERASLVAAVAMAAATGRYGSVGALPDSLGEYLVWRRRFDDLLTVTSPKLSAARRLHNREHEGVALDNRGVALRYLRRFDEAIAAHQDAAAIFRQTGDRRGEGAALDNLGVALREVRRFDEAIAAHQDAAAICRQTGDRRGEGMVLNNLGLDLREVRRFDEAIAAHREAATICRETENRHVEGMALNNLGASLREARRFDEAIAAHQDAAVIHRQAGDRHGEGAALSNLGAALAELRRSEEAIAAAENAIALVRETGDRHGEGLALNNLGLALQEVRRFDDAMAAHREAAAIYRQTGDRHGAGQALNNLGVALQQVRRFDEAVAAHREAAAIYRQTGDRHREGGALNNLGAALREMHQFGEAVEASQKAADIFGQTGDEQARRKALRNLKKARAAQQG